MGQPLTVLERVEAGLDAVGVGAALGHVVAQQLARRDALPLEVLSEGLQILLAAGAGGAQQENAVNYWNGVGAVSEEGGMGLETYPGSA